MESITSDTVKEILQRLGPQILQPGQNQVAALPSDFKLQDIEQYLPAPTRIRAQVSVSRPDDFIAYVNRYKRPSAVIAMAASVAEAKAGSLAVCTLDYHAFLPNPEPSWGDHRITLKVKPSPEYDLLTEIDGKLLKQSEFARQLSDLSRFISSHHGADILEIVRAINLTSKGQFVSETEDTTGSRRFVFNIQIDARATNQGRTIDVPKHIGFKVRVFDGTPVDINAELIVRPPSKEGEELLLGIRLPTRRWLEQDVIDQMSEMISHQTGLLTIVGKVS